MSKIDKIYKKSKRMEISDQSRIVIMSDCHRGAGDNYDNFVKNKNIYAAALDYYYKENYTYIELGDGDDMWEVTNYKDIIQEHLDIFKILKKFFVDNRFIMLYGNHDICKKNKKLIKEVFFKYYDKLTRKERDLFPNLEVLESIILEYYGHEILLLHGHQVDFLNSSLWRVARFLVRYIWRPLENFGFKDPTSAAKNYRGSKKCQKKLLKWSKKKKKMLITGHTHKPMFPCAGDNLYFNDGACIHPNGVTALEIINGSITLVRWELSLKKEQIIAVRRRQIETIEPLTKFYQDKIDKNCLK